jgi:kynurenine formamidase
VLAFDPDRIRIYDLGLPLERSTPHSSGHPPFQMALVRRHGDVVRDAGFSSSSELLSLGGHTGTHIDAICHVSAHGRLHGDIDALDAGRGGRYTAHGIDTAPPIIGRGVFIDAPAHFRVDHLDGAQPITAADIEAFCARTNVSIGSGDTVLIRTGWAKRHGANLEAFLGHGTGVPGPDESAARWLAEQGVRATGSDTHIYERVPLGGLTGCPVHLILLFEHGIHILELLDLEALAKDEIREFVFVVAPLKIVGGTGSPVRPLALVATAH